MQNQEDAQPMDTDDNKGQIDEALWSRQLYVIDKESMSKMRNSSVLLVGLRGLGVEIAKNLMLTGVKSVTLLDDTPTSLYDLSANFYLTEQDIGKPRAAACVNKLAELNSYVTTKVITGELTPEVLAKFQVVVLADQPWDLQLKVNQFCHANEIRFISTSTRGVFANIFVDFGESFEVTDPNGEPPATTILASITQENPAIVTIVDDQRLPFEENEWITFTEVQGMSELNGKKYQVKPKGPYTFEINEDTTKFGAYKTGGYATQVKQPVKHKFLSLQESSANPVFLTSDFAKEQRQVPLHLGFRALDIFQGNHKGQLPGAHNEDHALEVVKIASELNAGFSQKVETLDEKIVKELAYGATGELSAMCAFIGGIAAQETLKAVTGKFTPINQWFYFDATETLPTDPLPASEYQPIGSRYDGQIAVYGRSLQEQIRQLNYFLVGAGAIGCEVLKIWAMMGLGTGSKGQVYVTDMDIIEKSNLSRQFLFRAKDIEQLKSKTAADAVKKMNPEVNIISYSNRVGPETEAHFNDKFYNSLHGVCNALDNVEARMYMDSQCILYKKPLLESGTLGTKGNTQVIVPHMTESYASSRDPPEKSIPTCTLHHFPNTIDHTIQWARDIFEGLFHNQAENVNGYLTNPQFLEGLAKQSVGVKYETLSSIKSCLVTDKPIKFDQCVQWARARFEDYFNNNIQQLLYNFPVDMVTANGAPFWSGPKRAPKPIVFDPKNPLHLEFVIAAANLRAVNFGLKGETNPDVFVKICQNIMVPEFVPKRVKINTDEKKNEKDETPDLDEDEQSEKIMAELPPPSKLVGYKMTTIEFEKDDDTNYHMDFITAAANLRATNYAIPNCDKHKAKGIAGKIIPAMVTTTAVVCGLVCLELLKMIQNKKLDDYKNGFVNLALPFFGFSEPIQPPSTKVREGWSWTLWDRFEFEGPMTLQEFIDEFNKKYQLRVTMISCGVSMIYSDFMTKDKLKDRLPRQLTDVVEVVTKQPLPEMKNHLTFEVCVNRLEDDEDAEGVDVPFVRYVFRK